jgi:hypothetical protein
MAAMTRRRHSTPRKPCKTNLVAIPNLPTSLALRCDRLLLAASQANEPASRRKS